MQANNLNSLKEEYPKKIYAFWKLASVFKKVDRHLFVPKTHSMEQIYSDECISIKDSEGNQITSSSQPSLMARMLNYLRPTKGCKVLEIGAGTGYNAALLAELIGEPQNVYTIDINETVVKKAKDNLAKAGYSNVNVIAGDGSEGYDEGAPYDRIIVTAGASEFTRPWITQLADNGILLAPFSFFGDEKLYEILVVLRRRGDRIYGRFLHGWVGFMGMLEKHHIVVEDESKKQVLRRLVKGLMDAEKKCSEELFPYESNSLRVFNYCQISGYPKSKLLDIDAKIKDDADGYVQWYWEFYDAWIASGSPELSEYQIIVDLDRKLAKEEQPFCLLRRHCADILINY